MAHSQLAKPAKNRRFVFNLRCIQRPLCSAAATLTAATLALGLQATVSQAGPAQVRRASAPSSPMAEAAFAGKPISGRLTARDTNGQINIRRQPTVRSPILSQGYNQEPLYIFKSALTPQGQRWYLVEHFATGEQGWVHGDFVRLDEPGKRFPQVSVDAMPIDPVTGKVIWDTLHAVEERPEVGIIVAQDVEGWVNVRWQPSIEANVRNMAYPGDSVYIYRAAQFSSPAGQARAHELWYYVAFLDSAAEGWVHSDFIESAWESDEPFEVSGFGPQAGRMNPNIQGAIQLFRHPFRDPSNVVGQASSGEAVTLLRKQETARGDLERTWYWGKLANGQEGWVSGAQVMEQG